MKTDYSELAGKEVDYVYSDGTVIPCVVVMADYSIGLTIARRANKNLNCVCLHGRLSPRRIKQEKRGFPTRPLRSYRKVFHRAIKQIRTGKVFAEDLIRTGGGTGESSGGIPSSYCPFSQ